MHHSFLKSKQQPYSYLKSLSESQLIFFLFTDLGTETCQGSTYEQKSRVTNVNPYVRNAKSAQLLVHRIKFSFGKKRKDNHMTHCSTHVCV